MREKRNILSRKCVGARAHLLTHTHRRARHDGGKLPTGGAILKILRRHVDIKAALEQEEEKEEATAALAATPSRRRRERGGESGLGKFYFAGANSKAKMTKSRRKIAKLLPASDAALGRPALPRTTLCTVYRVHYYPAPRRSGRSAVNRPADFSSAFS